MKNHEGGKAERTFEFKTLPAGEPEIARDLSYDGYSFSEDPSTFTIVPGGGGLTPTSAGFTAQVESNGAATEYHFEYALAEDGHAPGSSSPSWKLFSTDGSGSVSVAEDYAKPEATVTGLTPETTYFVRLRASNENGKIIQNKYFESGREVESVTTPTARPEVYLPGGSIRNVTDISAHLEGNVTTDGSKTVWRFEYAPSVIGPWLPVPGAEGTVSLAEAQAHDNAAGVEGTLEHLVPETTYYVRLFAENECAEGCGEGRNYPFGELVSTETQGFERVLRRRVSPRRRRLRCMVCMVKRCVCLAMSIRRACRRLRNRWSRSKAPRQVVRLR